MTRTVVVGKATEKQREVYNLEKRMLEDTEVVIRAGISTKDIYKASLKAIVETEYDQYAYSNIGHGIGLSVHEYPHLSNHYHEKLEKGNVITVEQGMYIPGWGEIRIEDQVLVTEKGM